MKHLTKIDDKHYQYKETFDYEFLDENDHLKFDIRFNGSNWYTTFMDAGGETPEEVVEEVLHLIKQESWDLLELFPELLED
jgi:translation initiation factor IF-3